MENLSRQSPINKTISIYTKNPVCQKRRTGFFYENQVLISR